MKLQKVLTGFVMLCGAIHGSSVTASTTTIGPNGIDSVGLTLANGTSMNGGSVGVVSAVAIGQVELHRPGKAVADGGFDDLTHSSPDVKPTNVFRRTTSGVGIANLYTDDPADPFPDHAEEVASTIIGTDIVDPDGGGPRSAPTGVALAAALYSSATDPPVAPYAFYDRDAALTINHLARMAST